MKKILAIALVSLFGFAFGCGPKAPATEAPATPETPSVAQPATPEVPAADAPATPDAPEATP
jgi:hypothetical protein